MLLSRLWLWTAAVASATCLACGGDSENAGDRNADAAAAPRSDGSADDDAGEDATGAGSTGVPTSDAWPSQAAGPLGHYRNDEESEIGVSTAADLEVAWMHPMPGSVTGTPAIVDGVVYATSSGGTRALALSDGSELWASAVTASSSPAFANGRVFVNDDGHALRALDAEDGTELWATQVDPHLAASGFSSPVPVGDVVLVGISSTEEAFPSAVVSGATFKGGVAAYDQESGRMLWRHATAEDPANGCAVWGTVSADPESGAVYAPTGNNYTGEASERSDAVFAADLATGELLWNSQTHANDVFHIFARNGNPDWDFGATPIAYEAGGRRLVAAGQKSGQFWAFDAETGQVVWNVEVSPNGGSATGGVFNNGAFDGERILVAGNSSAENTAVLRALDAATGEEVWMQALAGRVWAPITVANGVCFVPADLELRVLDCATGEMLSTHTVPGSIGGGAAIAQGHVVFGSGFSWSTATPGAELYALALP